MADRIYRDARYAAALRTPPPIDEDDELVAGQLLALAMRWTDEPTRAIGRFAEALAKVTAEHGLEYARGWLAGIWYVRGNNRVDDDLPLTYHGVVYNLQGYLSVEIVKAPRITAKCGAVYPHGTHRFYVAEFDRITTDWCAGNQDVVEAVER